MTMPPECWPEVARQVLHALAELDILGDAAVLDVEAGVSEVVAERLVFAAPLPMADEAGEAAERFFVEAERLADLARGGLAAIGDDVGGHGRAEFAVALVDVLDGLLALVAGGQIEVDVGPFVAVFVEEALEEQVHADGVDGGDFERVADDGVGGAAAALDEDVVALAELDDVPHDEEVAGEAELFDERELVLGLLLRALPAGLGRAWGRSGLRCLRRRACAGRCPWGRLVPTS